MTVPRSNRNRFLMSMKYHPVLLAALSSFAGCTSVPTTPSAKSQVADGNAAVHRVQIEGTYLTRNNLGVTREMVLTESRLFFWSNDEASPFQLGDETKGQITGFWKSTPQGIIEVTLSTPSQAGHSKVYLAPIRRFGRDAMLATWTPRLPPPDTAEADTFPDMIGIYFYAGPPKKMPVSEKSPFKIERPWETAD